MSQEREYHLGVKALGTVIDRDTDWDIVAEDLRNMITGQRCFLKGYNYTYGVDLPRVRVERSRSKIIDSLASIDFKPIIESRGHKGEQSFFALYIERVR